MNGWVQLRFNIIFKGTLILEIRKKGAKQKTSSVRAEIRVFTIIGKFYENSVTESLRCTARRQLLSLGFSREDTLNAVSFPSQTYDERDMRFICLAYKLKHFPTHNEFEGDNFQSR
ncbi:CLUMA_CG010210, isoform A [Clunio marinus]|uniref:CLUMA_CG010210, isoform A n=1 Tax=Clunio marinus TaxID=568069 RepID=A0A1J1I918_9DIPT|nr:CLUMA_CG010210, isoform A [Clunio marinus]